MPKKISTPKRPHMVRTIVLQATGEIRRIMPIEIGLDALGALHQQPWKSTDEYVILRVVSDGMEPER